MSTRVDFQAPVEFDKMAAELEQAAEIVRNGPEIDHHLAEMLQSLAKEIQDELSMRVKK